MIELVNETGSLIIVNDMGIELDIDERIEVDIAFTETKIINSLDLQLSLLTIKLDNVNISYETMIRHVKRLNHYNHLNTDSHAHNILDDASFATEKIGSKTSKITYYRDAGHTDKLREESIIRDVDGVVIQIVSEIYDDEGNIEETETQTLNRGVNGTVDNITIDLH